MIDKNMSASAKKANWRAASPNQSSISPESIPERFALCRRKLKKRAKKETQRILAMAEGHSVHTVSDKESVGQFEDTAYAGITWRGALAAVSYEYGLLDVGGKPRAARSAQLVVAGKVTFEEARSAVLADKRHWQSLAAQDTADAEESSR